MIAMTFKGWPVEAVEFYEGLQADNTKTYWQQHKSVYEQCVKKPMEELLAELADDFGTGRVFRPYRDVRFSKDKTPYKLTSPPTCRVGTSRSLPTSSSSAAGCTCPSLTSSDASGPPSTTGSPARSWR